MDYLKEIERFNELLPSSQGVNTLTISLWHALMFFSHKQRDAKILELSLTDIKTQSKLGKDSLYKEREKLCQLGLISYTRPKGRMRGVYEILPLSETLLTHLKIECSATPNTYSATPKIIDSECSVTPNKESATQNKSSATTPIYSVTQNTCSATQNIADSAINSNNINIYNNSNRDYIERNKENIKRKKKEPASEKPTSEPAPQAAPKPKSSAFHLDRWLATIESPWQTLMKQWLEYKSARKESYKTEMGAKKCLSMLRNLSQNNPATAQSIIDQSIACNYAGLFPLKQSFQRAGTSASNPNAPQYGQRIGQITQPADEQRRQRLIDKLAGNKND